MQQPPFYNQPTGTFSSPYPPEQGPPKKSRRRLWIILAIIGGVLVLSCSICGIAGAFAPPSQVQTPTPTATSTQAAVLAVTTVPTLTPTDTATPSPTPKPTATPTPKPVVHVTPTSKPQPTHCVGINNNPWCYDFNYGKTITYPPSGFCSYFNCIPTFYGSDDPGDGYIIECQDGTYSQSGGESGACSYHGGESRPLYSH